MPPEELLEADSEKGAQEEPVVQNKQPFYPDSTRRITEDELKSPAAMKMLLAENERTYKELSKLKEIEDKYHKSDKDLAVAQEKIKQKTSQEILSDFNYSIGGALLALSSVDFKSGFKIENWIFIVIGLLFISGAIISKWRKK